MKLLHPFRVFGTILFLCVLCFLAAKPSFAQNTVFAPIQSCTFPGSPFDKDADVILQVKLSQSSQMIGTVQVLQGNSTIKTADITNLNNPERQATDWSLNLGKINRLGEFDFRLLANSAQGYKGNLECSGTKAFRIVDAQQQARLSLAMSPTTPITRPITTIDRLSISGLTAGYEYKFYLYFQHSDGSNRTGNQAIKRAGNDRWQVPAGKGFIDITDMCEDGTAERPSNGSNPCTKFFASGDYYIEVHEVTPDRNIGTVQFKVDKSQNDDVKVTIKPAPPIKDEIKTIDEITITGLPDGFYRIALDGKWNGKELGRCPGDRQCNNTNRDNMWEAKNGTINAYNICENGNTNRTGDQKCGDTFKPGDYTINVNKDQQGLVKSFTFKVEDSKIGGKIDVPPPCLIDENSAECVTALGKISATPDGFIGVLMRWGTILAGLIAFILIMYGGFTILTSNGDSKKMENGRAYITSAIIGLIFILASVFLLSFIGNNILGINLNPDIQPPVQNPPSNTNDSSSGGSSSNSTNGQGQSSSGTSNNTSQSQSNQSNSSAANSTGNVPSINRTYDQIVQDTCSSIFSGDSSMISNCRSAVVGNLNGVAGCSPNYNPSSLCGRKLLSINPTASRAPACQRGSAQYNGPSCLAAIITSVQNTR